MVIFHFFKKSLGCILLITGILLFGFFADARNNRQQKNNVAVKRHEEVIPRGDCVTKITHIFRKDLPLARFSNPYITNRIYEEINKRKYLQGDDDELYIGLVPDSMLILSRCVKGLRAAEKQFKLTYSEYIGHIKYNGHIIPIVTDRNHPIPWMKLDSTQIANGLISINGVPCDGGWNIITINGMLRGREPIDSLTRNEMIHSWFDK